MDMNVYQDVAMKFAKYSYAEYPFLALAEEAGEVMGKLAKQVRKQNLPVGELIDGANTPYTEAEAQLREDLIKELGDVLWQWQACCHELGIRPNDVATANIEKLAGRSKRGTIVGEGDDR